MLTLPTDPRNETTADILADVADELVPLTAGEWSIRDLDDCRAQAARAQGIVARLAEYLSERWFQETGLGLLHDDDVIGAQKRLNEAEELLAGVTRLLRQEKAVRA